MPKAHTITFNLANYPYYNSNLQRIVQQYEQYQQNKFVVVDVGANIGDTLLMLRQVTSAPVHCFEGNDYYFDLLSKNTQGIPNAFLHKAMLSSTPGSTNMKSEMGYGTAELVAGNTQVQFDSLDNFFANKFPGDRVGVLKTDTDGYDIKILYGAANLLTTQRPVVFLEYDRTLFEKNGDDGTTFFNFMKQHNYNGVLVYDNYGKLVCVTHLDQEQTIASLHSYIKNNTVTFPFFDLAIISKADEAFFNQLATAELAFFER